MLYHGIVSVILPTMNEVESLNETVRIIVEDNPKKLFEFLIVLSPKSEESTVINAENLGRRFQKFASFQIWTQQSSGLGGAIQESFSRATGQYTILMASDLETNPFTVKSMISLSEVNPDSIIVTSRWINSNSFKEYGISKMILNYSFQKLMKSLFKRDLSDWTFGFRLYPTDLVKDRNWHSKDFSFLLESIICMIDEEVSIFEVATNWSARQEGSSSNSVRYFLGYFKIALKYRRHSIVRKEQNE